MSNNKTPTGNAENLEESRPNFNSNRMKVSNYDHLLLQENHFAGDSLILNPEENDSFPKESNKFVLRKFSEFYLLPPFSYSREPWTKYSENTSPSFTTFQSIPNRLNGELSLLSTVGKYLNVVYPPNFGSDDHGYILAGSGGEFKHTFDMSPISERLTLIATMFLELPDHNNNSEVYKFEGEGEKGVRCKVSLKATAYTTDGMSTTSTESVDHPNVPFLEKGIYGNRYNRDHFVVISILLLKNTRTIEFEIDFHSLCYVRENPSGDMINNSYSMMDFRSESPDIPQGCVLPGVLHPCINKPKTGGIKITKIKCELFQNFQYSVLNNHVTN